MIRRSTPEAQLLIHSPAQHVEGVQAHREYAGVEGIELRFATVGAPRKRGQRRSHTSNHIPYDTRPLTQLAQAGCDAFILARMAGHSSITITQRYIHPQADAIERAFAPLVLCIVNVFTNMG